MKKKTVVIGGGIAGLSSASFLAKSGFDVTLLEKNEHLGGRARKFSDLGFTFDMGPSWYWMPDVFEKFYNQFGHTASDFYNLKRLDPSYKVFWEDNSSDDIPASIDEIYQLFEKHESGSSNKLKDFLNDAEYKYNVGMNEFVYKPSLSLSEFMDFRIVKSAFKLHLFKPFSAYARKYFKNPKLLSLIEFPTLFLGAMPNRTPALYSLMNYADICLGTWYPEGGMHKIIEAFEKIAIEQGVKIMKNNNVEKFNFTKKTIDSVRTSKQTFESDIVVSSADYHHTDQVLLGSKSNYNFSYWNKREMAPSSLLFYVGVNKKLKNIRHHNLFFDESFETHSKEIYLDPKWPIAPLFYVCAPSITDQTVAPENNENLFFLIPIAPNLMDNEEIRNQYFDLIINRFEKRTGNNIKSNIIYKRSYCISDFKSDYNAFKGNAYGLANTLKQTAIFKPSLKNNKLNNMYYTGQLTVPGPGVPPSIISGEVVANQIIKDFN